jgi:hypothetical protein
MADEQPTMDIRARQMAGTGHASPSHSPPAGRTGSAPAAASAVRAPAAPDMQSTPSLPLTAGAGVGAPIWQTGKNVEGLWSNNEDGNSWMGVSGLGWKKLAHPDETSAVALTMLAAHARCTNSTVDFREEADNMVHEVYVW